MVMKNAHLSRHQKLVTSTGSISNHVNILIRTQLSLLKFEFNPDKFSALRVAFLTSPRNVKIFILKIWTHANSNRQFWTNTIFVSIFTYFQTTKINYWKFTWKSLDRTNKWTTKRPNIRWHFVMLFSNLGHKCQHVKSTFYAHLGISLALRLMNLTRCD